MTDPRSLQPPIWVDTQAGFRAMLGHLQDKPALAIDTESNSLYVYREQVCLIQVSVPGADYLVDPLVVDDLSDLGPLLADPGVLKVFHGAGYDLRVLHRDFEFTVANLFDTMWASRILGWPAHGLGALLEAHFGVKLNKRYQRANWGERPLPSSLLDYARLDTHYLLPLYEIEARELDMRNRWPQARHRFSKLVESRWEPKEFDPDGFWRLSGARNLDDTGRGVLRELYLFRDRQARAENRPPFRVISNQALLAVCARRPQNLRGLRQVKGISPRMAGRYGQDMLAAIRQGVSQPLSWHERIRPQPNPGRPNGRPSAACQARFEALRAWRNTAAEARGVEPDMVLTNQVLWDVASQNPRCRADLAGIQALARWQADEFGDDLLKVVQRMD
jgi:ribonuclease D